MAQKQTSPRKQQAFISRILQLFLNPAIRVGIVALFLIFIFVLLYKIYIPRWSSFGCFDDCFNIVGGYFLTKGRHIYSGFFFNHQPGMAYLSAMIQSLTHPVNIYELIVRHRQALLLFSFVMDIFLIGRFAVPGAGFVLFYEFSKFYLFGDRFLAEGFVVYPMVYLFGAAMSRLLGRLFSFDYFLLPIAAWFVIWMREPYVLLSLVLYLMIILMKGDKKFRLWSAGIFGVLMVITLGMLPIKDYIFNVFTLNAGGVFSKEVATNNILGVGILKIFFYPFIIPFTGVSSFFRSILLGVDIIFLIAIGYYLLRQRKYIIALCGFLFLGLANIRYVPPGLSFYAAFHMLVWYALFIFTTCWLIKEAFRHHKAVAFFLIALFVGLFIYLLISPQSYLGDPIDQQVGLLTNYGTELQIGSTVKALSHPSDTLFLDDFGDLIYWQANRMSPYKYTWYTSLMPDITLYANARLAMFRATPPDFYFGACPKERDPHRIMPSFVRTQYTNLLENGFASCLWIKNSKILDVSPAQWQDAKSFLFTLPATPSRKL